jgi:hypothetical protein
MHVQCNGGDRSIYQGRSEGKRQPYPCDNSDYYNTVLTSVVADSRFVSVKIDNAGISNC